MARGQMNDDELDVEMLMFDLQRRIDANPAAGRTHGNQIPFPRAAKVRALVDRDRTRRHARVMRAQSKGTVDIELVTDLRTMIMFGRAIWISAWRKIPADWN